MTSTIKIAIVRIINGTPTSNTGKSTFTGVTGYRSCIFVGHGAIGVIQLTSEGTASTTSFNSSGITVTNGTNSFTVNGLAWWDYPYLVVV